MTASGIMWGVIYILAGIVGVFAFASVMALFADILTEWSPALLIHTVRWSWYVIFGGKRPVFRINRALDGGSNGV